MEGLKGLAAQVPHRPLDPDDEHIKDQAAPEPVAIAVDDEQATARPQNSVHLLYHPFGMRIMMETVTAGDGVEGVAGKGKSLAIGLDPAGPGFGHAPSSSCRTKQAGAQVKAANLRAREALPNPGRKQPGPTAYIENLPIVCVERFQQHPVGRPEEQ